ncbi:MAG: polysaccharide deacetylase [Bacteroidota bacterium]|nr:polysaccharide deacetylase [Bacteroidota bacterium]
MSFDVEEFDIALDYNNSISKEEQLAVGYRGLVNVMKLLAKHDQIKCTFFTTAFFATHFPETIQNISVRHEIASHTCSNSSFKKGDLLISKTVLEEITSQPIHGFRMPQMKTIEMKELKKVPYSYDASINPTWLPGRYNNLNISRTAFYEDGMVRIPASVSTNLRIPLFWLSFKNFPYSYFKLLAKAALKKDGYLSLYFHPWEFTDLSAYKIPWFIKNHSKAALLNKLNHFIEDFQKNAEFITMYDFLKRKTFIQNE